MIHLPLGSEFGMAPRFLLIPALVCCLAACDSPVFCTLTVEPAIEVVVKDSKSGLPAAEGAIGYVSDGDYLDSLRTSGSLHMRAANERPGLYTVVVIKNGYRTWKKEGVIAIRDECHVLVKC